MPEAKVHTARIEGGFPLTYQQLTDLFPEAKCIPQIKFDISCSDAVVLRRFQPGDVICGEGDFGSTAFYLLTGKVDVFIHSHTNGGAAKKPGFIGRIFGSDGTNKVGEVLRRFIPTDSGDLPVTTRLATLGAGELFGEMTCRNFQPRSATVQATEPCEVIEMLRVFLDLLIGQTDREPEADLVETDMSPPEAKDESPAPIGADGKPIAMPGTQKRRELKDKKPGSVWRTGFWDWNEKKKDFSWKEGAWEVPRPNHLWIDAHWLRHGNGWIKVGGEWQSIRLPGKPPEPQPETPPPAPSEEHQWRPGQWIWQPQNPGDPLSPENFVWQPGKWEKPKVKGTEWIPPRWEALSGRFRYVEGYELPAFRKRLEETFRSRSLANQLKSIAMFENIAPEALEEVIQRATFKSCFPGERICEKGDPADHFYLIRSGMVKVALPFENLVKQRNDAHTLWREALMSVAGIDFRLQKAANEEGYSTLLEEKRQAELTLSEAAIILAKTRESEAASVATYMGRGDSFGEIGLAAGYFPKEVFPDLERPERTATCIALDRVDLVVIHREQFIALLESSAAFRGEIRHVIKSRLSLDRSRKAMAPNIDPAFFEEKLFQAQNLLVIDLDRCTRCDECVRACTDAHDGEEVLRPVTRLVRDGHRYDHYLITAACRSCFDPLCMTHCPVSSVRRRENLEIIIEDWCIGCGMCAADCPFGNINMVEQFNVSPANIEVVQNGAPLVMTFTGVRVKRVRQVIAVLGESDRRAPGISVKLGRVSGNSLKVRVRAKGKTPPDPKTKINLVLKLRNGTIVDLPKGSGSIKVKPPGENAEIKPGLPAKKLKASTCDLCTGLDMPSCVYACPHDAAMRVFPSEFFDPRVAHNRSIRHTAKRGEIDRRTTHIRAK